MSPWGLAEERIWIDDIARLVGRICRYSAHRAAGLASWPATVL
jgi:hypothetical protein